MKPSEITVRLNHIADNLLYNMKISFIQNQIRQLVREIGADEKYSTNRNTIRLTRAEIQSGLDRVTWAERLIDQLSRGHDGRSSWLLNFGRREESQRLRENCNGVEWDEITQAAVPCGEIPCEELTEMSDLVKTENRLRTLEEYINREIGRINRLEERVDPLESWETHLRAQGLPESVEDLKKRIDALVDLVPSQAAPRLNHAERDLGNLSDRLKELEGWFNQVHDNISHLPKVFDDVDSLGGLKGEVRDWCAAIQENSRQISNLATSAEGAPELLRKAADVLDGGEK